MSNLTNTSDDILRCARSLIVAGGYNGFSYADISEVVGIRKASIHHHFPSKVDLVRTLVRRYREDAEAGLAELERHTPEPADQLRAYTGFWAACIADGTRTFCVCALLASEMPVLPPDVATEVKAYFRMFSAWLTSVMEKGAEQGTLVLSGTARSEAEGFMATVHGAMLSARAYDDPAVFATITQPLIERLIAVRQ
ncbi:Bacterial regulatory protein, tetR family [Hartmannibacter diazotrophicus]|uniref:Bacterial regulatory protein, tetR family n=1 Tax=Hartmannibacter diazotrophicus TaxID=1482074 RepID=A0A2C9DBW8_9HYPH|nr:TetR/AcrR family transcriptional regulator [Hartmannibacter diazotrophicus]SON57733.1 Bacterial regulatory protein, tetR family [Hartmannibacter diazotrophicus]